jgi:TRAP-type C4-dicarboxylate transport system permease small subunit
VSQKHDPLKDAARHRRPSFIRLINQGLSLAAGGMVGTLMFLIFVDVLCRYLFSKPIFGAYELVEVLMGGLIFAGLPLVSRAQQHISVDFVSNLLPDRWRSVQGVAINLLCAITAMVISWRILMYGERLTRVHETTLELQIPRGLIAQAMAVMAALTALAFFLNVWDSVKTVKSNSEQE